MSKRSSKKSKRRSKALPALGFAGVSLSMAGGACASTSEATANTPPTAQSNHKLFLGEEEIFDTSLSTFYTFDKENVGQTPLAQHLKLARAAVAVEAEVVAAVMAAVEVAAVVTWALAAEAAGVAAEAVSM